MHPSRCIPAFLFLLFVSDCSDSIFAAEPETISERIKRAQSLDKSLPQDITTNDWSFIRAEVDRGRGSNLLNILVRTLHQPVSHRTMDAITDLGKIGPAAASVVPSMVRAYETLNDHLHKSEKMNDHLHKSYLARSFGQIGPGASNAVPALIKVAQSDDSAREAAVDALGHIGRPAATAIPILNQLRQTSDDESLKFSCVNALARISEDPSPYLPTLISELDVPNKRDTYYLSANAAMNTFEVLGPKARLAIPALIKHLDYPDQHVRNAARALGSMGPHAAPAEKKLLAIINSQKRDEQTRIIAAEALGKILGGAYDAKAKVDEIKLTESQKRKSEWDKITRKYKRYTSALPEVTTVQLSRISQASAEQTPPPNPKYFPVHDHKKSAIIHAQTNLVGAAALQIADEWRSLEFGWEYQALCHEPAYGLRFYSGKRLLFETSVCWECHNFTVPDGFMGFQATAPPAQRFLQTLTQHLPLSQPTSH